MDLDPAAVQAATFALAKPGSLPEWLSIPALGRNMTPLAEIAVAAAAPLIARATADAIADLLAKFLRPMFYATTGTQLPNQYIVAAISWSDVQSVLALRSHGSQAQTTEDGQ
jgi:hypothetical protein